MKASFGDLMLSVDTEWLEAQERQVSFNLYLMRREILRIDDLTCEVTPRGFLLLREPVVPFFGGRLVDGQIWKSRDAVDRWLLLEALDMGTPGFIDIKARYLKIVHENTAKER